MAKRLTESDVTSRLAVPSAWWKLIKPLFDHGGGQHEVQLWVLDGPAGMFWEFRCAVRHNGRYKKPVFQSADWLKFVNHKGLIVGDKIFLEAAENEFRGTMFVLRAQRLAADGLAWLDV